MSDKSTITVKPEVKPSLNADKSGLLQRKCECGNAAGLTGECSGCQQQKLTVQRRARDGVNVGEVPSIVHELLPIQTKLVVGKPGDVYEQEADRVAGQVMNMDGSDTQKSIQRNVTLGKEKTIQPKRSQQNITGSKGNLESKLNKGGGSPLPNEVKSFMEPRFGSDFSQVRVHTDVSSMQMNKDLNAQAFTHASNIYFGAGKSPGNNDLTAHELTHVLQQTGSIGGDNLLQRKQQIDGTLPQVSQIFSVNSSQSPDSTISTPSQLLENNKTDTSPETAQPVEDDFKTDSSKAKTKIVDPTKETLASNSVADRQGSKKLDSQPKQETSGIAESIKASDSNTPQLDTSSSEGLLVSIASTPASSFGQVVNQSKVAATQLQSQEKVDLEASLPEIDRPTGLPSVTEREQPAPTILSSGQPLEVINVSGRDGLPPEIKHEEPSSPVPGSQVSTAASPPPSEDSEGSWWDWLVNRVNNFLGSIPAHDTELSTSAGSRPSVDMSGEADPSQNALNQQKSEQEVSIHNEEADLAVAGQFGEDAIYPTVPVEKLKSTYKPTAPNGEKSFNSSNPPNLPDDMLADFDQHETPRLSIEVGEQATQYQQQQVKYQQESQETRAQGQQQIAQENEQTRIEQQNIQNQAKGDVDIERQHWQEENHKIGEEYANQSKDKQQEIDRQIQGEIQSTDTEVEQKLAEAEQKAETARQNTEQQAADKKREIENEPRSFWDDVKDTISSVFDSLREAIKGLFEGLRKLVKGIIEAAKTVVRGLIEAARTVIVGIIKGFGEILKGLVSIALAAFPKIAAKARAWIDKRVDTATNAVNAVADKLKQVADAILDWVGKTLDKALSIVQGAFNLILNTLEFLAKAPLKMMNLLKKLAEIRQKFGSFIDGVEELINNPEMIENAAKDTLQELIDKIPEKAHEVIQSAIKKAPLSLQKHLEGIWRYLEPGLQDIKTDWWKHIKKMAWDLVWPFNDESPIGKDVPEMIHLPGKILGSLWDGEFSRAVDQFLEFEQKINSILGVFYGWFFIASILVGGIIGSIVPGPGTLAGITAGATFAGTVGEGLLAAMVETELSVIGKAVFDLAFGSGTKEVNESAYKRIAGSGLTLGITGVFFVLSEIAGRIASELVSGVKRLFKGKAPEAPSIKVDTPEVKADTPEVKSDTPETKGDITEVKDLGTEGGKKVLAEEPTPDGHKVKVTEEGNCLICSDCLTMKQEYSPELADPANKKLKLELETADAIDGKANPEAKAKAEVEIQQKLEAVRAAKEVLPAEIPETTTKNSSKRSGKEIGEAGKPWEKAVQEKTGGKSGEIEGREIDSITDDALIQAKDVVTSKPKNFLNQKTRTQIKETIRIARQQGKRAEFWFKSEPHPDVRIYIENKGGIIKVGL
jgi:Restriction endonuclease fold toxin 3/Domain of unknown function (DUF4157)/Putative RNase-like toxin, toxin_1